MGSAISGVANQHSTNSLSSKIQQLFASQF